jgi:sulfide:quinone oxidoreductase
MPGGEGMLKMSLKKDKTDYVTNMALKYVDKDHVMLADGRAIPYRYTLIVPPFLRVRLERARSWTTTST